MESILYLGLSNALLASLLALLAAAVGKLANRPALTHGLWLLVLLKLVTPSFIHLPVAWLPVETARAAPVDAPPAAQTPVPDPDAFVAAEPNGDAEVVMMLPGAEADLPGPDNSLAFDEARQPLPEKHAAAALPASAPPAAAAEPASPFPWSAAVAFTWLAGSLCWFGITLARIVRFQRLLRCATPAPAFLHRQAQEIACQMGLRRSPGVWLVPGTVSPMLWTWGGPARLLLPAGLLDRLSSDQLATVLAHELAHLRRRDSWVRFLEILATGLYWWHPVVWWARRELREAEEQCCDAWVVWAMPAAARTYANALLDTVDFLSDGRPALPPVASGVGQVRILKRRLTMIMLGRTPRTLSAVGLAAVLGLGAALLPLVPTWVQAEPDSPIRKDRDRERRDRERPDDAKPDRAPDKEKADKARGEMKKATEELRQAQDKLREATQKLGDAEGRRNIIFQRVQPGGPPNNFGPIQFDIHVPFGRGYTEVDKAVAKRLEGEIEAKTRQLKQARDDQAKQAKEGSKEEAERMAARIKLGEAELQTKKAQLNEMKLRIELSSKLAPPSERRGRRFEGSQPAPALSDNDRPSTSPSGRGPRPGPAPANNDRLQNLEKRMLELTREVEKLRKEMQDKAQPTAKATPPVLKYLYPPVWPDIYIPTPFPSQYQLPPGPPVNRKAEWHPTVVSPPIIIPSVVTPNLVPINDQPIKGFEGWRDLPHKAPRGKGPLAPALMSAAL